MTNDDPIVEAVRRAGQAYIDSFHGDRKALVADLRRRSKDAGHHPRSLPPKSPRAHQRREKKAS